jgi:hypothetical protein
MFITFLALLISIFWFYTAYLRKTGSDKLKSGLLALPDFFSFKVLLFAGVLSTTLFLVRFLPKVLL